MRKSRRRSRDRDDSSAAELERPSAGHSVVDSRSAAVAQARLQAIADQSPRALQLEALQSRGRPSSGAAPAAQLRAVPGLASSTVVQQVALVRILMKEGTFEAAMKAEMHRGGVQPRFRSALLQEAHGFANETLKEDPDITFPVFYFRLTDHYERKLGLGALDQEAGT